MSEGVLLVLWIFWTIAFLVLYHKVFTVYYFDLDRGIMKEVVAAVIMCIVGLTMKSDGDEQSAMNMNYMYCADYSDYRDQEFPTDGGFRAERLEWLS